MGANKSKLRRERKQVVKPQIQAPMPEQERKIKGWVVRLLMLIPVFLYACYLAWDLYQ